jgi:hypothetical protein
MARFDDGEGEVNMEDGQTFLDVPGWEEHKVMEVAIEEMKSRVDYIDERAQEMWENWPSASIREMQESVQTMGGVLEETKATLGTSAQQCTARITEVAEEVKVLRSNTMYVAEVNEHLQKGFSEHEARIAGVEAKTEQVSARWEAEKNAREGDVRALVDLMRREREQMLSQNPTPVMVANPEVEVQISRLLARMENMEAKIGTSTQVEAQIARLHARMDAYEKMHASPQPNPEIGIAKVNARVEALEASCTALQATHARVDALEASHKALQITQQTHEQLFFSLP